MTSNQIRVSRKEFASDEALEHLDEGRRVIVTVGVLGVEKEVVLRKNEDEYICDTGFKLFAYADREEMKSCIERLRLTDPDETDRD